MWLRYYQANVTILSCLCVPFHNIWHLQDQKWHTYQTPILSTTCQPLGKHLSTTCQPHVNHMSITYQPHVNHLSPVNHMTMDQLIVSWMSVAIECRLPVLTTRSCHLLATPADTIALVNITILNGYKYCSFLMHVMA